MRFRRRIYLPGFDAAPAHDPGAYLVRLEDGRPQIALYTALSGATEPRFGWYLFGVADPVPAVGSVGRRIEARAEDFGVPAEWPRPAPRLTVLPGGKP